MIFVGIPGDGRCLFRSVAHGFCLRSGKVAPSENTQRKLADELRNRVSIELGCVCFLWYFLSDSTKLNVFILKMAGC